MQMTALCTSGDQDCLQEVDLLLNGGCKAIEAWAGKDVQALYLRGSHLLLSRAAAPPGRKMAVGSRKARSLPR